MEDEYTSPKEGMWYKICLKFYPGDYIKLDDKLERLKEIHRNQWTRRVGSQLDQSNHCGNGPKKKGKKKENKENKFQGLLDKGQKALQPG